jgi:hypothetical protein
MTCNVDNNVEAINESSVSMCQIINQEISHCSTRNLAYNTEPQ